MLNFHLLFGSKVDVLEYVDTVNKLVGRVFHVLRAPPDPKNSNHKKRRSPTRRRKCGRYVLYPAHSIILFDLHENLKFNAMISSRSCSNAFHQKTAMRALSCSLIAVCLVVRSCFFAAAFIVSYKKYCCSSIMERLLFTRLFCGTTQSRKGYFL